MSFDQNRILPKGESFCKAFTTNHSLQSGIVINMRNSEDESQGSEGRFIGLFK